MNIVGIDPGWASCGYSLTTDGKVVVKGFLEPRQFVEDGEVLSSAVDEVWNQLRVFPKDSLEMFDRLYIERYVAYAGVTSSASEQILMFIGALVHRFEFDGIPVTMVRAIDWKPKVCKYLVRTQGFNNPHPSFDKKYSILAAEALSGQKFKTDHEADAVCLSYLGVIDKYNEGKNK